MPPSALQAGQGGATCVSARCRSAWQLSMTPRVSRCVCVSMRGAGEAFQRAYIHASGVHRGRKGLRLPCHVCVLDREQRMALRQTHKHTGVVHGMH